MITTRLLTEENVRIENWPLEIIPENAATSIDEIEDMVIRTRLSKGLPIMAHDLLNQKEVSTLAIPQGYKVVAIKVTEDDTIAGLLNPGDKVDVIGLFKTRDRSGQSRTFSKTFLKALRVFSVNAQMTAGLGSRSENSSRGSAIVGVLVTEKQSEAIVYVQKTGQLKLVLRGDTIEGDDDIDNDNLLAFGFPGEQQEEAEEEEEGETFGAFGSNSNSDESSSMIVWQGNEPQKVTFRDGSLPESTYRQPSRGQQEESGQENSDAEDDPDSFEESDRGLEEDQYRGE